MTTLIELAASDPTAAVRNALMNGINAIADFTGKFELHHVITRETIKNSEFIRDVYGIDEYALRFNSSNNLIALPTDGKLATSLGMSQHLGNHSQYNKAIQKIHRDLHSEFVSESIGKSPAEIADLKVHYRNIHDRVEFKIKDGLIAKVSEGGDIRPTYAIYGKDGHLTPSEKGWSALYDDIYKDLTWENLKSDPFFQVDNNGNFRMGDNSFDAEKQRIIDTGIFDAAQRNFNGHILTGPERMLTRGDADTIKIVKNVTGKDLGDVLVKFQSQNFFDADFDARNLKPEFLARLKKAGLPIGTGAAGVLLTLMATTAQAAAAAKVAYEGQYIGGAQNAEEATKGVVDDITNMLSSIKSSDIADILLNMVIDTQQKGRVAVSFGVDGFALVFTDFILARIKELLDIVEAFQILFPDAAPLKQIKPYVEILDKVIDRISAAIDNAIKKADLSLGNSLPEALVATGSMTIDRESSGENLNGVQYIVGMDGSKLLAGGGDFEIAFRAGAFTRNFCGVFRLLL